MSRQIVLIKRICIIVIQVLLFLCGIAVADNSQLKLDGMWLGGSLEEFRLQGLVERTGASPLLSDGTSTYTGRSSAHFNSDGAQIIGGLVLRSGSKILLKEGDNPKQVLDIAAAQGWPLDSEWNYTSDVAQHHNRVLKFCLPDKAYLTVVLFKSDFVPAKPEKVSELYLRTDEVTGPYERLSQGSKLR